MGTIVKFCLVIIVTGIVSACSGISPLMSTTDNRRIQPAPGKAVIVFIRPTKYGGKEAAFLYHDKTFFGAVSGKTMITYQATPGEHIFMVVGEENADFMKAELKKGRVYYAMVAASLGEFKPVFKLVPHNGQIDEIQFKKWLSNSTLIEMNDEGMEWAQQNSADADAKRRRYYNSWQANFDEKKHLLNKNSGL